MHWGEGLGYDAEIGGQDGMGFQIESVVMGQIFHEGANEKALLPGKMTDRSCQAVHVR
jgi:hypothetical protein